MDTLHVDHQCPRSHVTYQMLENTNRKKLPGGPIALKLEWGKCRFFSCDTYIDTEFSDPPTKDMKFPIKLLIVDDAGYDKNRITLGLDFIQQYIHSKKGRFAEGEILMGDNQGLWWATTYQEKRRRFI